MARLAIALRAALSGYVHPGWTQREWLRLADRTEDDVKGEPVVLTAEGFYDGHDNPIDGYEDEVCDGLVFQVWTECARRGVAPAHKIVLVRRPLPDQRRVEFTADVATRRLV